MHVYELIRVRVDSWGLGVEAPLPCYFDSSRASAVAVDLGVDYREGRGYKRGSACTGARHVACSSNAGYTPPPKSLQSEMKNGHYILVEFLKITYV